MISSFPNCDPVAQADDAEQALQALSAHSEIRLITLEIALPGMSGIEFLRELQRRKILAKTLVISQISSDDMITQALLAGAQGYVLKNCRVEDLETATDTVCRSNSRYLPSSIGHLAKVSENGYELTQQNPTDPLAPLSAREREIFHLLAIGLQNTAIAKKLFISPRTVETHRARIVRKLALQTNGELIRFAIKHGLSTP
jgi:DNA-binding NarL/FixJ family response regulator